MAESKEELKRLLMKVKEHKRGPSLSPKLGAGHGLRMEEANMEILEPNRLSSRLGEGIRL